MVDAQTTGNEQTQEPTGELILGKFKSQEALVDAYKNLEQRLGAGTTSTPPDSPVNEVKTRLGGDETPVEATESTQEGQEAPTEEKEALDYGEGITAALTGAGMDVNAVAEEYASEGGLTDETRQGLYKVFGQRVVDNYFSGLEAQALQEQAELTQQEQGIVQAVGGEDAWNTVVSWANGPNADQSAVEIFNEALDSKNPGAMKAAAMLLKSSYERQHGSLNSRSAAQSVKPSASGGAEGFEDNDQMIKAIQDPRYARSPAYRNEVAQKMANSKWATM